ncbi:hypothetical protein B296_00038993 [Ensete ventricosum]|uniref:Uncharacterized protein n=1 Tax=Ensete ventricosum TaxID=4639 RepID=A0A426Y8X2_ENSVE|nr:hypothetical protein B296_00038993 [Ensete ventricosum]
MALPLLRLPSSHNPHLSPSSPSFFSLPSPSRVTYSPRRARGVLLLRREISAFAALSSSAPAAPVETAESSGAARTRLIAQNVPWTCTADDIRTLFSKHGTVVDVEVRILLLYASGKDRIIERESICLIPFYNLMGRRIRLVLSKDQAVDAENKVDTYEQSDEISDEVDSS